MDEHEYGKPIFKDGQLNLILMAFWAFMGILTLAVVVGSWRLYSQAKNPVKKEIAAPVDTGPSPEEIAAAEHQKKVDAGAPFYAENCASCHGDKGEGNQEKLAPVLPHLQPIYLTAQIGKITEGLRDDEQAKSCLTGISKLTDDDTIESVVAYIGSLPKAPAPAATIEGGDPVMGKERYVTCTACHGQDGKGVAALAHMTGANLVGQADWYLKSSLTKFKGKIRGAKPGDMSGMSMGGVIGGFLKDEQAEKDVIAYILTLK